MSTDAAKLRKLIRVPTGGVQNVRWATVRIGTDDESWLPGPTDYKLYAYIEMDTDAWAALEAVAGPPTGTDIVGLPSDVASALLGPLASELAEVDHQRRVEGRMYDASKIAGAVYRPGAAIQFRNGLLLANFYTM